MCPPRPRLPPLRPGHDHIISRLPHLEQINRSRQSGAMFPLAVVLESGDVVGGGLDTQDEAEFVVDLDRGLTETMLDAGALDQRRELAADLLGELGSDLVAE